MNQVHVLYAKRLSGEQFGDNKEQVHVRAMRAGVVIGYSLVVAILVQGASTSRRWVSVSF